MTFTKKENHSLMRNISQCKDRLSAREGQYFLMKDIKSIHLYEGKRIKIYSKRFQLNTKLYEVLIWKFYFKLKYAKTIRYYKKIIEDRKKILQIENLELKEWDENKDRVIISIS